MCEGCEGGWSKIYEVRLVEGGMGSSISKVGQRDKLALREGNFWISGNQLEFEISVALFSTLFWLALYFSLLHPFAPNCGCGQGIGGELH